MSKTWYFVYGNGIDQNKLESNKIKIYDTKDAMMHGYSLTNKSVSKNNSMVTASTLLQDPKAVTLGTAFLIDDNDLYKIAKLENKTGTKEEKRLPILIKSLRTSPVALMYFPKFDTDLSGTSDAINSVFNGKSFGINRFKSESKFMKWEKNSNKSNGYVMTFEEFKNEYINGIVLNEIK